MRVVVLAFGQFEQVVLHLDLLNWLVEDDVKADLFLFVDHVWPSGWALPDQDFLHGDLL
jgi:hypothetical protein